MCICACGLIFRHFRLKFTLISSIIAHLSVASMSIQAIVLIVFLYNYTLLCFITMARYTLSTLLQIITLKLQEFVNYSDMDHGTTFRSRLPWLKWQQTPRSATNILRFCTRPASAPTSSGPDQRDNDGIKFVFVWGSH